MENCWLVVWNINFIFPYIGNNHPSWLIFLRGVQTTNQNCVCPKIGQSRIRWLVVSISISIEIAILGTPFPTPPCRRCRGIGWKQIFKVKVVRSPWKLQDVLLVHGAQRKCLNVVTSSKCVFHLYTAHRRGGPVDKQLENCDLTTKKDGNIWEYRWYAYVYIYIHTYIYIYTYVHMVFV